MALRPSSPTTTPMAPGPEPDDHHHIETLTQEEVEKGGGGDCNSHHSFSSSSSSPSPSPLPLREWDTTMEEWEEDGWGAPVSPSSSPRPRPRNNAARRDPHKAELFRRLDASCEAARLREAELLHPPPPPSRPETDGSDVFVWPPNTAIWRRFCYLRSAAESNQGNHVLGPAEDTSPHHPSENSRKTVCDKDDEQCYDSSEHPSKKSRKTVSDEDDEQCYDSSEHSSGSIQQQYYFGRTQQQYSSGSMPNEIVLYENDQGENHRSPAPSRKGGPAIVAYAAQCSKCQKWRLIPSKKKYEEIREKTVHICFTCEQTNEWKLGVTCDDPTDISQDDCRIWAIDKPGIAQPPPGWERIITIRSEGSTKFADVYYIPPAGKTLRSTADVAKYLEQNPQYAAGLQLSQFSFKIPAPLRQDYVRKRVPQSKALQPERGILVLPLASAPPIHEDNVQHMLLPYKEADPAPEMPQDQLLGASDQTSN